MSSSYFYPGFLLKWLSKKSTKVSRSWPLMKASKTNEDIQSISLRQSSQALVLGERWLDKIWSKVFGPQSRFWRLSWKLSTNLMEISQLWLRPSNKWSIKYWSQRYILIKVRTSIIFCRNLLDHIMFGQMKMMLLTWQNLSPRINFK